MEKHTSKSRDAGLILLSLPTLMWYLAFCYLPMFGIVIAFKQYRLIPGKGFIYSLFMGGKWIGLENFRFLFLNPQMSMVVRNTLCYNILFLIIDTLLPVALAILLSFLYSEQHKGMFQTVSMLPHFLSWVIVSYLAFAFLSTDRGLLNGLLAGSGRAAVRWYQEPAVWPFVLVITHTWKAYGYALVMYSAYLNAIDPSLYDSALVDGASVWQRVRFITLPQHEAPGDKITDKSCCNSENHSCDYITRIMNTAEDSCDPHDNRDNQENPCPLFLFFT